MISRRDAERAAGKRGRESGHTFNLLQKSVSTPSSILPVSPRRTESRLCLIPGTPPWVPGGAVCFAAELPASACANSDCAMQKRWPGHPMRKTPPPKASVSCAAPLPNSAPPNSPSSFRRIPLAPSGKSPTVTMASSGPTQSIGNWSKPAAPSLSKSMRRGAISTPPSVTLPLSSTKSSRKNAPSFPPVPLFFPAFSQEKERERKRTLQKPFDFSTRFPIAGKRVENFADNWKTGLSPARCRIVQGEEACERNAKDRPNRAWAFGTQPSSHWQERPGIRPRASG